MSKPINTKAVATKRMLRANSSESQAVVIDDLIHGSLTREEFIIMYVAAKSAALHYEGMTMIFEELSKALAAKPVEPLLFTDGLEGTPQQ